MISSLMVLNFVTINTIPEGVQETCQGIKKLDRGVQETCQGVYKKLVIIIYLQTIKKI